MTSEVKRTFLEYFLYSCTAVLTQFAGTASKYCPVYCTSGLRVLDP